MWLGVNDLRMSKGVEILLMYFCDFDVLRCLLQTNELEAGGWLVSVALLAALLIHQSAISQIPWRCMQCSHRPTRWMSSAHLLRSGLVDEIHVLPLDPGKFYCCKTSPSIRSHPPTAPTDTTMATAVDLSDGDIERLLQEAEARLLAAGKSLTAPAKLEVAKQDVETTTGTDASTTEGVSGKTEALSIREPKVKLSNKAFEEVCQHFLQPLPHPPMLDDYRKTQ